MLASCSAHVLKHQKVAGVMGFPCRSRQWLSLSNKLSSQLTSAKRTNILLCRGFTAGLGDRGSNSFADLGLIDSVAQRLDDTFVAGPLPFQQQAIPVILDSFVNGVENFRVLSGRDMGAKSSNGDVVLNAETGSGKTITYVAPLLSALAEGTCGAGDTSGDTSRSRGLRKNASAIVLCPNLILAQQAKSVICDVFGESVLNDSSPSERDDDDDDDDDENGEIIETFQGRPLVELIDGSLAPLQDREEYVGSATPIFYVATPGGLVRHMRTFLDRGRQRHFVKSIHSVVLDEADMLLTAHEKEM